MGHFQGYTPAPAGGSEPSFNSTSLSYIKNLSLDPSSSISLTKALHGKNYRITSAEKSVSRDLHISLGSSLLKDTRREKAPPNETLALTESTNMGIWVVGTTNQLFVRGS